MVKTPPTHHPAPIAAPLWRRLAAMVYDLMLVLAILMLVGFVILAAFGINQTRSLEGEMVLLDPTFKNTLFVAMLISTFSFFAWFWTHNGQTLGMKVWKIRVQTSLGTNLTVAQCAIRFGLASVSLLAFGLGYLWMLIDPNNRTWHDIASQTVVVKVPK